MWEGVTRTSPLTLSTITGSWGVRSSWEGRYTPPISPLPLCVLCEPPVCGLHVKVSMLHLRTLPMALGDVRGTNRHKNDEMKASPASGICPLMTLNSVCPNSEQSSIDIDKIICFIESIKAEYNECGFFKSMKCTRYPVPWDVSCSSKLM